MWRRAALVAGLAVIVGIDTSCSTAGRSRPLERAHAHNDYEHARPLLDALDHGFCSIEADVYLVDGRLLVAHDRKDVKSERTLESLYLHPLLGRVRSHGGRVYRGGPTVTLLVDVKSEARETYAALEMVLARYSEMLTRFTPDGSRSGAITVVVSGNRAPDEAAWRPIRFAALDGRSGDLDSSAPVSLYPWISENWAKLSRWRGEGAFPAADWERLRDWVSRAHARGRKIRFWNTPETTAAWKILVDAGVDLIGTDDLSRLRAFFMDASERRAIDAQ